MTRRLPSELLAALAPQLPDKIDGPLQTLGAWLRLPKSGDKMKIASLKFRLGGAGGKDGRSPAEPTLDAGPQP
jgi:hypothetical protein